MNWKEWELSMKNRYYGIGNVRNRCYGLAAALTYWVFKCRDRGKSPAMGTETWTFLEKSVQNSAEVSTCLEDYLQYLNDALIGHLRPAELTKIVNPKQRILRVNQDMTEIQELTTDKAIAFLGWHDLLDDIAQDGFSEWDVLELCRTKAAIIQVACRLRFVEDKKLGQDTPDEAIDVEAA